MALPIGVDAVDEFIQPLQVVDVDAASLIHVQARFQQLMVPRSPGENNVRAA